jgi:asparagine synthase (glutamine-hydrolysing)
MSGLCGICEPRREMDSTVVEPMLSALALQKQEECSVNAGQSIALGVARRWEGQEVVAIPGIRIAVDADLYNVSELKARLAARGLHSSDWQVALCLARLYEIEGPDFLQQLHGVFSLALWDEKKQRLVLAIDRLGVKSLYWYQEADRLLFATRLGAIRAARKTPLEINPKALPQYMLFSAIPHPMTIYRGVEKLPPATLLIYEKGELRRQRYWDLEYVESDDRDEARWARQVREGMRSAVHLHLEGCTKDKVGAYLSGGTDSSSIVAFMNERHSPVNTFSIFFSEAEYSEANFARATANHFRTRRFEKQLCARDAFEAIPKIAQHYDEPFANSSSFGAYHCAALAREAGMHTLLAGDGGDELFAGNSRYADDKRFALYWSLPSWLRRGVIEPLSGLLPANGGRLSLPRKYIRRALIPNPRRIFSYNFFLNTRPEEIFEPDFLAQAQSDSWMEIANGHFRSAQASSELNRLLYMDTKIILADNDLRKVTGTAELAGVRVRYPLLDYRLAELSGRIPTELKLKGFEKRYIFKKAMQAILPHAILYKKKHGFGVPLGRWLLQDQQLHGLMRDLLCDVRTRQRGYFRPAFFEEILRLHREDHVGFYGEIIWHLLALEIWHRQHYDVPPGFSHGD